jgi:serine/threonine protein phosphatase Stp1
MLDAGVITAAEAENHPRANVITRAVGAGDEMPALDKRTGRLSPGDRFLLCSDGLCKTLAVPDLHALLARPGAEATQGLIDAALARNVSDNVTAVVVHVAG